MATIEICCSHCESTHVVKNGKAPSGLLHIPVKMNTFSGKREHLRFPKHCLS
ncbi:IS1 family transposase [Endozoicomonas montiporae]|uniref:IS1 family transposase n=1 Tax=Endozoicomonas montiporae TaxID=1027273 RepID=UPI0011AA10FA